MSFKVEQFVKYIMLFCNVNTYTHLDRLQIYKISYIVTDVDSESSNMWKRKFDKLYTSLYYIFPIVHI